LRWWAELKAHLDCPKGIMIAVLRDGDSWEFRARLVRRPSPNPAIRMLAMLVQIGDRLRKQYEAL
jgi:hypothetical protein